MSRLTKCVCPAVGHQPYTTRRTPNQRGFVTSKTFEVESVQQFVSLIDRLRTKAHLRRDRELWFRAEDMRFRRTKLRPKLYRPRPSGKMKSVNALLRIEDDLYEEFTRCATQLCDLKVDPGWDFEWYFLMQHHGAATRLLDWTDSGLTALYFAVRDKPNNPDSGSIVYVVDPHWLVGELEPLHERDTKKQWNDYRKKYPDETSEFSDDDWEMMYLPNYEQHRKRLELPEPPLLWDAPHVSRRIAAQRSRFMIFGREFDWLEDLFSDKDAPLCAINIPRGAINRVKRQLQDAGMSESVLFPDLDGLGREMSLRFAALQ